VQKECLLNVCRGKHIFIILLEDGTMGIQEEDGHSISFSLGTGHDSIPELVVEEEGEGMLLFKVVFACIRIPAF
jgi:hypothetical protein